MKTSGSIGHDSSGCCDESGGICAHNRARGADDALAVALEAVRVLDIPHFELEDEEEQVVH